MLQNKQWIFNFIALLILLTGMCVDEVRADSIFVYPQSAVVISSDMKEEVLTDVDVESTVFICSRSAFSDNQIAMHITTARRTIKLSMVFLCVAAFSFLLSNFYAVERIVEFPRLSERTAVLNYIHNTDGKK